MPHRSTLEVDVVGFEVDVPEERLQWCTGGSRTNQGRVEGRGDKEDGRLRIVHPDLHELVVPYMHQIAGRRITCWVERRARVELALERSSVRVPLSDNLDEPEG